VSLRSTLIDLEALAAQAGVPVRYELMKLPKKDPARATARGGLIRVGKERFILCEKGLPAIDRIAVIAEALAEVGVEVLDLPPVLRARISGRPARPATRPKLTLKPIAKSL
jgi:hypothetical protein